MPVFLLPRRVLPMKIKTRHPFRVIVTGDGGEVRLGVRGRLGSPWIVAGAAADRTFFIGIEMQAELVVAAPASPDADDSLVRAHNQLLARCGVFRRAIPLRGTRRIFDQHPIQPLSGSDLDFSDRLALRISDECLTVDKSIGACGKRLRFSDWD